MRRRVAPCTPLLRRPRTRGDRGRRPRTPGRRRRAARRRTSRVHDRTLRVTRVSRALLMRRLDTVLFDLDDTLHDDTACYRGAAEQVAQEIAAAHAIDALALKAAYVMEAE